MRIEEASGRFIAERRVSGGIVVLVAFSFVFWSLSIVVSGFAPLRTVLFVLLVLSVSVVSWRSYRIEVDAASERITITKRTAFRTDAKEVGFRDVKKVLWCRAKMPLGKTLHRLDLLGDEHLNVIDERFRSLDSWSAADISRIANGIAQIVRVPIEERAF